MALWPTSLVALALLVGGCGQAAERSAGSGTTTAPAPSTKAQLTPTGQQPLTVKGTGFQSEEKVRVSAEGGPKPETIETDADQGGTFVVTFHFDACGSITVTATGSKGSRAQFNLSQIACAGT